MTASYTAFPAERLLLGPGPSPVPQRVLRALAAPTLGHLDPQYLAIMDEICEFLRQVFRTKNQLTFPVSGTGMAGMECLAVNLIESGDEVIVCPPGLAPVSFGERALARMDARKTCAASREICCAPFPASNFASCLTRIFVAAARAPTIWTSRKSPPRWARKKPGPSWRPARKSWPPATSAV